MGDIFDEISLEETPQGDIFDQISYEAPTLRSEGQRHLLRTASRMGETLAGLPGDILNIPKNIAVSGLKKLTKSEVPEKIAKTIGPPSSQDIRDLSFKIFGEKINPQNEKETFLDEVVQDATALAIPIKGRIPFVRAIGTAVAGNLSSETAKALGIGKTGQDIAKLGTFFLAGVTGRGSVKKYWNEQYKKAEDAIPKKAQTHSFGMERKLDKLERDLSKGISTPSKKFVLAPLDSIRSKIKKGTVKIEDLVQMKKDINELRGKLYKDLSGKQAINYAQGKINNLAEILDSEISKYGKENPNFFKHYKNANEAYGGFQQSKRVGRWISRHLKRFGRHSLLLLEALVPKLIPASIVGYSGLKSAELLTRIFKNKTLSKYYGNLVKNMAEENLPAVSRNLSKMEKEIKKSEPDIFDLISSPQKNAKK